MSKIIPAVSLHQPYACLVEIRAKPFETRAFPIPARLLGRRVAIHATKHACIIDLPQDVIDDITDAFGFCGWNYSLPRGFIVATAVLAESIRAEDVTPDSFGDYRSGRWAWRLEDVRPVNPHIPATGRQMIGWAWEVPAGVRLDD